jgi:putative ABC transport system permease protein
MRHTLRLLLKSPGFTITAIAILGLGIGANTAIFSLIESVLLKPLTYPRPDQLVEVFQPLRNLQTFRMCYPDYLDFCANQHSFQNLAVSYNNDLVLTGQGDPVHLTGSFVTANYFQTLGRPLLAGRPFGPSEDRADTATVVILGERFWRERFRADPTVVGAKVQLNQVSYEIIGVCRQRSDEIASVYLPFNLLPELDELRTDRANHGCWCIGRLAEGVTLRQAQADLEITAKSLAARFPDNHKTITVRVAPLLDSVVGDFPSTLWLIGGSVALLLVIACANVAGLHLARSLERQKEMMIRASLGASKTRLVLQLMGETMVLSLAGGAAGFILGHWGVSLIRILAPSGIPRFDELQFDNLAFVLVLGTTVFVSLLAGSFPAFAQSRVDLTSALRTEGTFGGTRSPQRQRTQFVLIVCQVALASILLFGCILLARSLQALRQVPLGFNPNNLLITDIYLPDSKYRTLADWKTFFDVIIEKVRKLPGVTAVGTADVLPFSLEDNEGFAGPFAVVGQPEPDSGHKPRFTLEVISPDYFRALQIPLLQGRAFDAQDQLGRNKVVIVNQTLADTYFPGQNPIGKQIHDFGETLGLTRTNYTIVGVVPTVYQLNPARQYILFQTYFPLGQPHPYRQEQNDCTLVVRNAGNAISLLPAIQKAVASLDPDVPLSASGTLDDLISKSFETRQVTLLVVTLFSMFALTLSLVGVYAILARSVSLRTREIGIRVAVGAQIIDVVQIVFWQGMKIVSVGLTLGIVSALVLGQFLSGLLYGITSYDPATIAFVIAALTLAAVLAFLIPTVRAIRINPVIALRE